MVLLIPLLSVTIGFTKLNLAEPDIAEQLLTKKTIEDYGLNLDMHVEEREIQPQGRKY